MPKEPKDLRTIFIDLANAENRSMSHGVPRLKAINDYIDLEFLKYKLRLYTRYLSYAAVVTSANVDVEEADFSELTALIERRPELLGIDPVCASYWRVVKLQKTDYATVTKASLAEILKHSDDYADYFTREERLEVIELLVNFCIRVGLEAQPVFVAESKLLLLRGVVAEFEGLRKVNKKKYLSENAMQSALTLLLDRSLNLDDLSFMTTDAQGNKITDTIGWVLAFSQRYARFLRPEVRKPYRTFMKLAICYYQEEYLKCVRLAVDLNFAGNDSVNLAIKRILFQSVCSLRYHGSTRERRLIRRMGIDEKQILERIRKHLEYVAEHRPRALKVVTYNRTLLEQLRKIYQLYKMSERAPLSESEKLVYDRLTKDLDTNVVHFSSMTQRWLNEQLALLKASGG